MITKNKLPASTTFSQPKSDKKKWVILVVVALVVAGATFGVAWLIHQNTKTEVANDTPIDPKFNEPSDNPTGEGGEGENSPGNDPNAPMDEGTASIQPITSAVSNNPTVPFGRLMLINPNFKVESSFIAARAKELISLSAAYGIKENNPSNGDNLMDKEAAEWLSKMVADYTVANPGHTLETRSCFREVGTNCGRLCMPTGSSDHHTGLTCDLVDPVYGTSLDTSAYSSHIEWQWLKENSYKYGFIDRFPEAWAGGSMAEPMNVDENGSTGLFETWHYRYVGTYAATEIATGLYNNGQYDSLEHYLKARGLVTNLLNK